MKYLDLFSGYGGFSLGIQQAYEKNNRKIENEIAGENDTKGYCANAEGRDEIRRHGTIGDRKFLQSERAENIQENMSNIAIGQTGATCIGFSEVDKYAISVYKKQFPNHKNYGDITKINASELPDFELLVGGFPCQAFSIAGNRGGFEDTRGTLIFDVFRIIKEKRPKYALLENVKGLVSHDGGKTLETILLGLQELGYYVNIEIYNAKDFGVPQNRERIFFICRNKKQLESVFDGQKTKIDSSIQIIQEWLFQLLLNNLKEVQKLQETTLKDSVLAYLIWKEISQNLKLKDENIKAGITMGMEEKLFQSKEEPWRNIALWLKTHWEENYLQGSKFTTLTASKQITDWKTCDFSKMLLAISSATETLRNSSPNLWSEVLSNLILIKTNTSYERINHKKEGFIVTEDGNAHLTKNLQDFETNFIVGHLGGFGGRKVFPLGQDATISSEADGTNQSQPQSQIASTIRTKEGTRSDDNFIVVVPEATKKGYAVAEVGDSINFSVPNSKTRRGRVGKGVAQTLDTGMHQHTIDDRKIRRLTPTECERLMGLPDGWTEYGLGKIGDKTVIGKHKEKWIDEDGFERVSDVQDFGESKSNIIKISDSQRYKLCGNGVVVNVVQAIIERLI